MTHASQAGPTAVEAPPRGLADHRTTGSIDCVESHRGFIAIIAIRTFVRISMPSTELSNSWGGGPPRYYATSGASRAQPAAQAKHSLSFESPSSSALDVIPRVEDAVATVGHDVVAVAVDVLLLHRLPQELVVAPGILAASLFRFWDSSCDPVSVPRRFPFLHPLGQCLALCRFLNQVSATRKLPIKLKAQHARVSARADCACYALAQAPLTRTRLPFIAENIGKLKNSIFIN
jgi:hypothetical protein